MSDKTEEAVMRLYDKLSNEDRNIITAIIKKAAEAEALASFSQSVVCLLMQRIGDDELVLDEEEFMAIPAGQHVVIDELSAAKQYKLRIVNDSN